MALIPDEILEASLGRGKRMGISDVEADGLVPELTRLHCATFEDLLTGEHLEWTPDNIREYPEFMMDEVGVVVGHNFIGYDHKAIAKVADLQGTPYDHERFITFDTLIGCKKVWPADVLIGPDMKRFHSGRMPAKYLKRQSLGAWGYRLGNYKGEYGGGWDRWSPEMQTYMVQDGKVNLDLFLLLLRRLGWELPTDSPYFAEVPEGTYTWPYLPIWIEMQMARIISDQEDCGVGFDSPGAVRLASHLLDEKHRISESLREVFGAWWAPKDNPEKGRANNRDVVRTLKQFPQLTGDNAAVASDQYTSIKALKRPKRMEGEYPKEYWFQNSYHVRIEHTEFNPSSRDHLADRLQRVFGWKPETFTPSGKPQVDESVIESIPSAYITEETRTDILNYYVVSKTEGLLTAGAKAWMQCVGPDGCLHGRCDTLGTVSGRGSHFNPNLGQVPSVDVEEIKDEATGKVVKKVPKEGIEGRYGWECRSLFIPAGLMETPPPGREEMVELTGTDMSGLEFVLLGHYLYRFDEGDFARRAADPDGDLHAEHGERAGLTRRDAKTLGYLIIYGGGAWKAGLGMGVGEDEIGPLLLDRGLAQRLHWMRKRMGSAYEEPNDLDKARIVKGARGIKSIKDAIPGLEDLMADIQQVAKERGYVIAIDGAKLFVRKPHAALNTLLQGGGAVACKLWIIYFHMGMRLAGYRLRVHYNQVLWVHDEKQNEHVKGLGPVIEEISEEAAHKAAETLKLRGSLRTASKTGRSWAETH